MPVSKNQLLRFHTILKMMRQSRCLNFPVFLREMRLRNPKYELASKTFQRDIRDLRKIYNAPISYDASRRGYFLVDSDWYNENLPAEPFEIKAVLLGERVASNILPEPLRIEMDKAVGSLMMKNANGGMAEGVELENFQVLPPGGQLPVNAEVFLCCYKAWEEHKCLRLDYSSAAQKNSRKLFEPHIFAWKDGKWYLKGKVLRSDDERYDDAPLVRVLALHRIMAAEVLDYTFEPAPEILQQLKKKGLFNLETLPLVELEFFKPADLRIYEQYCRQPGVIKERTADSVRIELKDITEFEAAKLVMNAMGNARIHQPRELKEYVRSAAEKILESLKE